jgi:hypothetical protein
MTYNKKAEELCARKLQIEYTRTRKELVRTLKRRQSPEDVKIALKTSFDLLNARLARILFPYMARSSVQGKKDAEKELGGTIKGAAPSASIGFGSISDPGLKKITHHSLGQIGKYDLALNKSLIKEYDRLLSDNKLANSLRTHGWTPWMGETLKKKGIDSKVISLLKQQSTSAKMLSILNQQGIRGGMHPDQVARRLIPHVNRYFGPSGVKINNVGKKARRFMVDSDGNYKWVEKTITRKYKATPRTYSRLVAGDAMTNAHREAYYQSLQKTGLVDHFISISVMDARTCGNCAVMHGQIVTHADGPQYHSRCHCDLRPVFKRDSLLGDKNKPDRFYERQRDLHFLRMNDLKRFNETMPSGSKLANFALLPQNAKSGIMPGPLQMNRMRHMLMGQPAKVAPMAPPEMSIMSDAEWRTQANTLYAKTEKDGVEHMRIFAADGSSRDFKGGKHGVEYVSPKTGAYTSIHTHPAEWDCPLSDEDLITFLRSKRELQMAATSRDTIYLVTKQKGHTMLRTTLQEEEFEKDFRLLMNGILSKTDAAKYSGMDYHNAALHASKKMAEDYGLKYQIIARTP